jgi:hypothetical protein
LEWDAPQAGSMVSLASEEQSVVFMHVDFRVGEDSLAAGVAEFADGK